MMNHARSRLIGDQALERTPRAICDRTTSVLQVPTLAEDFSEVLSKLRASYGITT